MFGYNAAYYSRILHQIVSINTIHLHRLFSTISSSTSSVSLGIPSRLTHRLPSCLSILIPLAKFSFHFFFSFFFSFGYLSIIKETTRKVPCDLKKPRNHQAVSLLQRGPSPLCLCYDLWFWKLLSFETGSSVFFWFGGTGFVAKRLA